MMNTNRLYFGDNLEVLRTFPGECVDLCYIDPPFNSARNFSLLFKDRTGRASEAQQEAFTDTWTWTEVSEDGYREIVVNGVNRDLAATVEALRQFLHESAMMAYIVSMTLRFVEIHRLLKSTGSFYLHCDPVASHYLKVILDVVFGPANFRNEITWKRTSAHSDAKHKWADLADSILFYAKTKAAPFHPQYSAHAPEYVADFYRYDDGDGRGPYRRDNMASPNPRPNLMYEWQGFAHPAKGWRYSKDTMQRLHDEGRIHYPAGRDGQPDTTKRPSLKRFLEEQEGTIIGNVWTDIAPVQAKGESLGYPTQKPLALLERIVAASSVPGDLVLDAYCGCGTTVTAAHQLGRRWIGIDVTAVSIGIIKSRLENTFDDLKGKVRVQGFPADFESARVLFETDPHLFQIWATTLIDAYPLTKKGADSGIDGWLNFFDLDDTPHRAVVQVKGGKVQVGQVRDLAHVRVREKADRRMEAEAYLLSGYGLRTSIEARPGWVPLGRHARVWQPSRLKGTVVSREVGTPFLAATQVFDLRPIPRKWLALERTEGAEGRFVKSGMMLVTCSGSVGRATLAYAPHLETLISHDLLRVEARDDKHWGWLYAYLRAPTVRAMMTSAQYGHMIKHLEVGHLNALPLPELPDALLDHFTDRVRLVLALREEAHAATLDAEERFEERLGPLPACDNGESGFIVRASDSLFSGRRRMDGLPHNPVAQAMRQHLAQTGAGFSLLKDLGFSVWLPGRFRRVPAEDGVTLVESSDLFEINPDMPKRIADVGIGDPHNGRVQPGWLLLARSGQIYGLLGSLAFATAAYADKVVSDDVIRIAPLPDAQIRPGYVYTALTHPSLGRMFLKALAYGSSIPHIEPSDLARVSVVRIAPEDENYIADRVEQASAKRAEADLLENVLAEEAERILSRFISGDKLPD